MFPGVIEVEMHLPGVGIAETPSLQIDNDQTTKTAVEEDEIHTKPYVIDAQSTLTSNECEFIAQ